jgi:hypothetical protein
MELELIRGICDYHWWGNRKLFAEAAALGEETARKDLLPSAQELAAPRRR